MSEPFPHQPPGHARGFATTQWSIVLAAGNDVTAASQEALSVLCERYWYPLYAYVRRRGYDAEEAQDLTQEFFARLIEKQYLREADRERGRFRAYLLVALKHFLANEYDRGRALKRGGGRMPIRLDAEAAEGRYAVEPRHDLTPERIYEQGWALALLDRVLARVRAELAGAGQQERFEALKGFLSGDPSPYSEVAAQLGIAEGAAKVAVHRLRKRYRDLLRAEIAETVADPADVDDEIRNLFSSLAP